jgi:hypothetical protein
MKAAGARTRRKVPMNDKKKINEAFKAIRKYGIAAFQNVRREGVTEQEIKAAGGINGSVVYFSRPVKPHRWSLKTESGFDEDGNILGTLFLSWKLSGDECRLVCNALTDAGLDVTVPKDEAYCIEVRTQNPTKVLLLDEMDPAPLPKYSDIVAANSPKMSEAEIIEVYANALSDIAASDLPQSPAAQFLVMKARAALAKVKAGR